MHENESSVIVFFRTKNYLNQAPTYLNLATTLVDIFLQTI